MTTNEQPYQEQGSHAPHIKSRPITASLILFIGIITIIIGLISSISHGAADIELKTVWEAIFFFQEENVSHHVIQDIRLPRAIASVLVGAFLAVSGAIMQGMTRNPLASPSLMGITSGATFAITLAFVFFPSMSYPQLVFVSFLGAALGTGIVYGIGVGSPGGLTPVKLALAGAAVSAMLGAISSGLAIYFQLSQEISFWQAGGLVGVKWEILNIVFPLGVICLLIAIFLARYITILSFGEEVAIGLGQRTGRIKLFGTLVVLLLTGAAVAIGGAIGFIGLVIPHITRFLVGADYRWVIPCSAVLGGALLVGADLVSRLINPPFETPVGAVTAAIGVPFFLYLARKEGRERT
ncbi:FecCD family ABC transporter permease [Priestia taiwanensis]|uniref:Ferrichrome ABC transporter permease n=1 Tax=Priestia taiwanensis TaxID=1347902 RepID=A0A917AXA1_9BACI|nr:iron ABC transporter permease [Priestia taiwanensis]MBM7365278.1 iron complex transport system permease protein [Priestia taiwanensis]GGE85891.1 ferrichrome ABC transporter permease [Priestia taiwanensis]